MSQLALITVLPKHYFYIRLSAAFLILFLCILFKRLLSKLIIKLLSRIKIEQSSLIENLNNILQKPLDLWFIMTGIYVALLISPFTRVPSAPKSPLLINETLVFQLDKIPSTSLHTLYKAICILIVTWAIYNFEEFYELALTSINSKYSITDNTILIRFTAKMIRFITIGLGIAITIAQFIQLGPIIAGVGLGGVAFTLIAKDTLTNLMSGVVLMIDKPFIIGDWVQVGTLEGLVEDVSFRSTRIRTFTQGIVVFPNAKLSNDNIINWSKMSKRRVSFDLGMVYGTTSYELSTCITAIEELLQSHEEIEPDSSLVYFNSFGDYALNITVTYYSLATQLVPYSKLKETINLEIMTIIEQQNLSLAFPTQNIIIDRIS